jgi:hypothetical protein
MTNAPRILLVFCVLASSMLLLGGCNACEELEKSLCKDLGEEDCALWKEADGPSSLYGGRRENRACINMSAGPSYDAVLKGAKAVAEAQKKIKAKKK